MENIQILYYMRKGEILDQESEKAIEYVKNNWVKTEKINEFDVCQKNVYIKFDKNF